MQFTKETILESSFSRIRLIFCLGQRAARIEYDRKLMGNNLQTSIRQWSTVSESRRPEVSREE